MFHLPPGEKPQRPKPRQPRAYRNPIILAREWQQALASGNHGSRADLARQQGISRARVTQVLQLLNLVPDVLNAIAALGDPLCARSITERTLRCLVHHPAEEQRRQVRRIFIQWRTPQL
jgi:ParB-like chromosome segregation protein Spo0J